MKKGNYSEELILCLPEKREKEGTSSTTGFSFLLRGEGNSGDRSTCREKRERGRETCTLFQDKERYAPVSINERVARVLNFTLMKKRRKREKS